MLQHKNQDEQGYQDRMFQCIWVYKKNAFWLLKKCQRGRVAALCVIDTYANGEDAF